MSQIQWGMVKGALRIEDVGPTCLKHAGNPPCSPLSGISSNSRSPVSFMQIIWPLPPYQVRNVYIVFPPWNIS